MDNTEPLPQIFDTIYDLKTKEQLQNEVEYLAHRLAGIIDLCFDYGEGQKIQTYVNAILFRQS